MKVLKVIGFISIGVAIGSYFIWVVWWISYGYSHSAYYIAINKCERRYDGWLYNTASDTADQLINDCGAILESWKLGALRDVAVQLRINEIMRNSGN